jgi:hypothetical protein
VLTVEAGAAIITEHTLAAFNGSPSVVNGASITINGGTVRSNGQIFSTGTIPLVINDGEFRTAGTSIGGGNAATINGGRFYSENTDYATAFSWTTPIFPQGKTLMYDDENGYYRLFDLPPRRGHDEFHDHRFGHYRQGNL